MTDAPIRRSQTFSTRRTRSPKSTTSSTLPPRRTRGARRTRSPDDYHHTQRRQNNAARRRAREASTRTRSRGRAAAGPSGEAATAAAGGQRRRRGSASSARSRTKGKAARVDDSNMLVDPMTGRKVEVSPDDVPLPLAGVHVRTASQGSPRQPQSARSATGADHIVVVDQHGNTTDYAFSNVHEVENMAAAMEEMAQKVHFLEAQLQMRDMLFQVVIEEIVTKYENKMKELQQVYDEIIADRDERISRMCHAIETENERLLTDLETKEREIELLTKVVSAAPSSRADRFGPVSKPARKLDSASAEVGRKAPPRRRRVASPPASRTMGRKKQSPTRQKRRAKSPPGTFTSLTGRTRARPHARKPISSSPPRGAVDRPTESSTRRSRVSASTARSPTRTRRKSARSPTPRRRRRSVPAAEANPLSQTMPLPGEREEAVASGESSIASVAEESESETTQLASRYRHGLVSDLLNEWRKQRAAREALAAVLHEKIEDDFAQLRRSSLEMSQSPADGMSPIESAARRRSSSSNSSASIVSTSQQDDGRDVDDLAGHSGPADLVARLKRRASRRSSSLAFNMHKQQFGRTNKTASSRRS